tara:strand:- start:347 stop:610 length:264 start_codon:yes stop_codon:yes gene_type:complete
MGYKEPCLCGDPYCRRCFPATWKSNQREDFEAEQEEEEEDEDVDVDTDEDERMERIREAKALRPKFRAYCKARNLKVVDNKLVHSDE